ncbi:MAG: hypothetical protein V1774_11225 [Candidatus Eisenbacteria bacterium]
MMSRGKRGLAAGAVLLLSALLIAIVGLGKDSQRQAPILALNAGIGSALAAGQAGDGAGASRVVLAFGVGSVLTRDGTLWVYRPDTDLWLTIDEAFKEEGRETKILPLPVAPSDIAEMESFGFLLTKGGESWLYEFTTDRWRRIPPPPQGR